MKNIFELESSTDIASDNSYIMSYPIIMDYFHAIKKYESHHFVIGTHIIYGWMPTALDLYTGEGKKEFTDCAVLLNKAKNNDDLDSRELKDLKDVVNNSLVGTSKVLHFVNPSKYPIWDSKIYSFVNNEAPHNYRVNDIEKFINYKALVHELIGNNKFPAFYSSVKQKLGYEVSEVRAIELIMFLNSSKYDG